MAVYIGICLALFRRIKKIITGSGIGLNAKSKEKADYVLDFRGAISSIALLEMSNKLKEMKANQILVLFVRDEETIDDIVKMLPKFSCTNTITSESGFKKIIIKKTENDT